MTERLQFAYGVEIDRVRAMNAQKRSRTEVRDQRRKCSLAAIFPIGGEAHVVVVGGEPDRARERHDRDPGNRADDQIAPAPRRCRRIESGAHGRFEYRPSKATVPHVPSSADGSRTSQPPCQKSNWRCSGAAHGGGLAGGGVSAPASTGVPTLAASMNRQSATSLRGAITSPTSHQSANRA